MDNHAAELIRQLDLAPHPEGGHYRRVYASQRRDAPGSERPALTAIRFLLAQGEASRWHRVDGDEAWHWQAGDALELLTYDDTSGVFERRKLSAHGQGGEPMLVVPSGIWQAARALGRFTLVGCSVSPGFIWGGFELAAADGLLAARLRQLDAWID